MNTRLPSFWPHEGEPDEGFVLVAVADQQGFRVVHDGEDGVQLRLGPGFEADVVRPAEFYDFFHHLALLVHLDRVDAVVLAFVVVFLDGVLENGGQAVDAGAQNIGEPEKDGQRVAF